MNQAVADMLTVLAGHLPPAGPAPLPAPGISLVRVTERAVGLGSRRGTATLAEFPLRALKGLRLDAVVRFQLWAGSVTKVDAAVATLHGALLGAQQALWSAGFLRVAADGASLTEEVPTLPAWRATVDYRVLYEFRFEDTEGAESLIARVPIEVDAAYGERTVVTDAMARWDKDAAPVLEVRGRGRRPFRLRALSTVAFRPAGWDGGAVTLSATVNGTARQRVFASVRAFVDAFALDPATTQLGPNPYRSGLLAFPNGDFPDPIALTGDDLFRISYADGALDSDGVVYLRALS